MGINAEYMGSLGRFTQQVTTIVPEN